MTSTARALAEEGWILEPDKDRPRGGCNRWGMCDAPPREPTEGACAELKEKLERALATGEALRWGIAQRGPWVRLLAENGVELLSATQLRKRKIALLPDAKPLVWAYFGAPIAKHRPLYWVGRQTEAPPPLPLFEARA